MMFLAAFEHIESEFFRTLNQFVEPFVRAGIGAPGLISAGAIVIETKGRKTGRSYNVPLIAALAGDVLVVTTVRRKSNWLRNLSERPAVRYWLRGKEHYATAFIIGPGFTRSNRSPKRISCLSEALQRHSSLFGTSFAILIPEDTAECGRSEIHA